MQQKIHKIKKKIVLLLQFLLLFVMPYLAFAQGHGSYGGIADGIAKLALIVILIVGVLVMLGIKALFGKKAALIFLSLVGMGYAYLVINGKQTEAKRLNAYKDIEYAFAVGCSNTLRTIDFPAKGDERVFIRLQGDNIIPEFQQSELLPAKDRMAQNIELVKDLPSDLSNSIVIDIKYSRDLMPGSYPEYEWKRTRYDLTARLMPEDKIIAKTIDMQARNGFCIGHLEAFLQRALNRPDGVFRKHESTGKTWPQFRLPEAYVRGEYAEGTKGVYLKTKIIPPNHPFNNLDGIEKFLSSKGCNIVKSNIAPHIASCGDAEKKVEILLYGLLAMHELPNSWLFIYRDFKGIEKLTSLRFEERRLDLQVDRVWVANLQPPSKLIENGLYLNEFVVKDGVLTGVHYADQKYTFDAGNSTVWFEKRYEFKIPIPKSKM